MLRDLSRYFHISFHFIRCKIKARIDDQTNFFAAIFFLFLQILKLLSRLKFELRLKKISLLRKAENASNLKPNTFRKKGGKKCFLNLE